MMTTSDSLEQPLPCAVFLMGPTAAGKTALAMELAEHYPFEIISVDSALVYKGMDIGTAKPDASMLERAPHRLLDIIDPSQSYSAAQFRQDALAAMAEITASGKIPLLVGGTMMYFKFLRDGAAELPQADAELRAQLMAQAQAIGWPAMHERLASIDPVSAARLAPNDSQRIARALEVFLATNKTLTQYWQEQNSEALPYKVLNLAVCPRERTLLHQRIAERFHIMLEAGFLDEVKALYQRQDLHVDLPSIRSVGYRQAWSYLEGELSYEQMIERGIIATRQLAKRQITWLRSWPDLYWLRPEDENLLTCALKIMRRESILNG